VSRCTSKSTLGVCRLSCAASRLNVAPPLMASCGMSQQHWNVGARWLPMSVPSTVARPRGITAASSDLGTCTG
jgi:hypothetical protein